MKNDFVKRGKSEMTDFVIKAIDDLLQILDSPIEFPIDKNLQVIEHKLFAVVQSREQVYSSTCELMDMIDVEGTNNQRYKNKIIQGMQTTWHEMTEIVKRDIRDKAKTLDEITIEQDNDIEVIQGAIVTDDKLTSISKAKVLAAKLSYQILDRIALLEDPDKANEEILKNSKASNMIEKFVEN